MARELHDTIAHGAQHHGPAGRCRRTGPRHRTRPGPPRRARDPGQRPDRRSTSSDGCSPCSAPTKATARARPPGPGQLDALVAHVRARRATGRAALRGRPHTLPVGIDVSTYRIIQEGLTNALKHAGPLPPPSRVRYQPTRSPGDPQRRRAWPRACRGAGGHGLIGHARARRHATAASSSRSQPRRRLRPAGPPPARTRRHMIRILIADDQALVRGGLRMILDAQPDLEVVGEAADGRDALEHARELAPDLVLMDIRMPELDGLEATRRLLTESAAPRSSSSPPSTSTNTSTRRSAPAPAAFCSRPRRPSSSSTASAPSWPATHCSPRESPADCSSASSNAHPPAHTARPSSPTSATASSRSCA